MSNQYLSFDVTKQSAPQQLITGRQGDSQLKFVTMLLWDGDKNIPYDLTGKQVVFEALKPDNTHIVDYEGITILDATAGLVRYSFNEQVFSVAGTMQQSFFKITHTDSDNNVISDSTLEVAISILENRVEFGINSEDYLSEYDDLIVEVKKKFDDYASTVQDSITKAQALHDQIVEYTNLINSGAVILKKDFGEIGNIKQPIGNSFIEKLNNEFYQRGVNVKWYGAKGDGVTDDTNSINSALNYASENNLGSVFIPNGTYMIDGTDSSASGNYLSTSGGIELKNNVDIIMEESTVMKIIPNSQNKYVLFRGYNVENITISGGSLVGDRDKHTGKTGEWGYGISFLGSNNITIKNINISNFWGDGINLQVLGVAGTKYCQNINIKNVICTKNRRQGMSVEGVDGLLVENSEFSYTQGTLPECGIDVEPWSDQNPVKNITFRNCKFLNNHNAGLLVLSGAVDNIVVENNIFDGNTGTGTGNGQLTTFVSNTSKNIKILNNLFLNDTKTSMALRGGQFYVVNSNSMEQGILTNSGSDSININNMIFNENKIKPISNDIALFDTIAINNISLLTISKNEFNTSQVYNGRSLLNLTNVKDATVHQNYFNNSPRSIDVKDSFNITISENILENAGIFAVQLEGASKNIRLSRNTIFGACHKNNAGSVFYAGGTASELLIEFNKIYQEPRDKTTYKFGDGVEIYTFQYEDNAGLDTMSKQNINIGDGVHAVPTFSFGNVAMKTGYLGEGGGGIMSATTDRRPTVPKAGILLFDLTMTKLLIYDGYRWRTVNAE